MTKDDEIKLLKENNKLLLEQLERFGLGIDEFHRNICNKLVAEVKQKQSYQRKKTFSLKHLYVESDYFLTFTEEDAPDWLTGEKTVKGSTMDNRWFWDEHVITLNVGESVKTDFSCITRIS